MLRLFFNFIIFLIIVIIVQVLGSVSMRYSDPNWYAMLNKPSFTPPDYVFGIVWPILYLMIAVSGFLIWKNKGVKFFELAITFWALQLFFNMIWTFLFFYLKSPLLGLIDIILIWVFSVLFMIFSINISIVACSLFVPYLLWISFAFLLNLKINLLN
ncbi:MAG: tryptophan-rich sensory protein [Parachlamydiales bacterium]|nr:tryptophan-rich sensory protein [Parachlamydiales bacterium]